MNTSPFFVDGIQLMILLLGLSLCFNRLSRTAYDKWRMQGLQKHEDWSRAYLIFAAALYRAGVVGCLTLTLLWAVRLL